jgi:lipopolysaccharide O-acetyltransferase
MRILALSAKGPATLRRAIRSWLWGHLLHAPGFSVGDGCQILGDRAIQVGRDFRAGRLLWLEAVCEYGARRLQPVLSIGDRVSCSDSVHIACALQVTIGNDVLIGSKVHVTDHNHGRYRGDEPHSAPDESPVRRPLAGAPVVIGDRVFLADGVVVLAGSVIGSGTVVGANSVVSGTLPPETICIGVPARPVRRFDREGGVWQPLPAKDNNTTRDSGRHTAPHP